VVAGKQAKVLSQSDQRRILQAVRQNRYPDRDTTIILLSIKAGLRAGEIARLTWPMVLDPQGNVSKTIELHDSAAKKCSGRTIPLHPDLRRSIAKLKRKTEKEVNVIAGPVITSERGNRAMRPSSIVNWFASLYRRLDLSGCSSHSGRRTFVTKAARLVHEAGGSLRDVQQLAGHRSIQTTQGYIEGDTEAKRRLVALL